MKVKIKPDIEHLEYDLVIMAHCMYTLKLFIYLPAS